MRHLDRWIRRRLDLLPNPDAFWFIVAALAMLVAGVASSAVLWDWL